MEYPIFILYLPNGPTMVWTPLSDTYVQVEAAPGKVVSDIAVSEEVKALNQTISLPGNKPLYNYGLFLTPGLVIADGLLYLKAGIQTQVNNNNINPNFDGHLFGLGYKQLIYGTIYLFGEVDYISYQTQTTTKTLILPVGAINASVTTRPQGARYLIGLGINFN
jgi:hypothetical protein